MRRPGGYAIWTDPNKPTIERDSFTCVHCNNIVFVEPRQAPSDAGGWCMQCNKPICQNCAKDGRCIPFLRKIDQEEAMDRLHRQILGDLH